ncbi:MAG TPA: choice-of-anchor tandem repeat GloVer-containing protein, partial [Verrucomicrobiae bacterium]
MAIVAFAIQSAEAAPYKLIHAFKGGAADGREPGWASTVTISGSTMYGVTLTGSKYTNGVVFQMSADGTGSVKILHAFNGKIETGSGDANDGDYPIGTPVLVGSTLYGMTEYGGTNGIGCIYSVGTDGSNFQMLHHFGALNDGFAP